MASTDYISTGIPEGGTLGPNFLTVSGNYLSGVTGLYMYASGSGFDISTAQNLINPSNAQVSFTTFDTTGARFSCPSGISGTKISGYYNIVLQSPYGTGLGASEIYIKYPPVISGFGPVGGFVGDTLSITGSGFFSDTLSVWFSGAGSSSSYLGAKIPVLIDNVLGDPVRDPQVITAKVPGLSNKASYYLAIDNGVGWATGGQPFSFAGAPKITEISPTSGIHGASIKISGEGLNNVLSLKHGDITIDSYSILGTTNTGILFTVPNRVSYLEKNAMYQNISGMISLTTAAGSAESTDGFLTLPDDIIFSGFQPTSQRIGEEILISGGNIELTTGVTFTGVETPTVTQTVYNDGFFSEFHPTGITDYPKTGLILRLPYGITDGEILLEGSYSSAKSSEVLNIKEAANVGLISPSSGVMGDTITLSGQNITSQKFYLMGYESGTIKLDEPVLPENATEDDIVEVNKFPTIAKIEPLETRYIGSSTTGYAQIDLPNGTVEDAAIYGVDKSVSSPTAADYTFFGIDNSIKTLPLISGISHSEIKVGETLYVTGVGAWDTLANCLGISGTGLKASHDDVGRELEFVSTYNTKLEQDGQLEHGRDWMGLGDHFIPNDPATLMTASDPYSDKYNADIRKHLLESGKVDTNKSKTGVFVIPVQVGDNFVGTGQVFLFFNEPELQKAHHAIVEEGPDTVTTVYNGTPTTFKGRFYQQYDVDGDGVNDPFFWSGATTGTDFQYGHSELPGQKKSQFYKTFTGTHTYQRFQDILYKGHSLVVNPPDLRADSVSPRSGVEGTSATILGSGLNVVTGVFYKIGDTQYQATISSKTSSALDIRTPYISWPSNSGFVSGVFDVHSQFVNATTTGATSSGHFISVKPPTIDSFSPTEGIEGEGVFTVLGVNLQYVDSLSLVSQYDGDSYNVDIWGKTEIDGVTAITGLTPGPNVLTVLPHETNIRVSSSTLGSDSAGTYTVNEGDVTIHGNLYVDKSAHVKQNLDVSGRYLLDSEQLEASKLPGALNRQITSDNLLLHLDAQSYVSNSGLNTEWRDISANKNNATLVNTPTANKADFYFDDDSSEYGTISMDESLKPDTFTVGVMFKPNELGASVANPIFQAPNLISPVYSSYEFTYDSAGRVYSHISFDDGTASSLFTNSIGTGSYKVVNASWDGTTHTLYLDGEIVSTNTVGSKNISYHTENLNILTNQTKTKFLDANIRNIHLYSGAIGISGVRENYNRLTKIQVVEKDLEITGSKLIVRRGDNFDSGTDWTEIESNKVKVSGDDAGFFVNGVELDPSKDTYKWENITFTGDRSFNLFQSKQGTGTSNVLSTSDTLVGSVGLNMGTDSGEWKKVKLAFGTRLDEGDSIKGFVLKERITSTTLNWPYKATDIDRAKGSGDYTYIAEGIPEGALINQDPLVLDLYAQRHTDGGSDVHASRSLYAAATFTSGGEGSIGRWDIDTAGDSTINFYPNTGTATLVGTGLFVGNDSVVNFPLEYYENDISRVFVSLDGISLTPSVDYSLLGSSGVALIQAPKVGEEVLIRQITPSIETYPFNASINVTSAGAGGVTISDLSTGTQLFFSGDISGLDITNYNIYDSNVDITGGGQTIYNQYTGIDIDIDNIGDATAVNITNEPGGSADVTSSAANVVVANEGTNVYITEQSSDVFVYSNTGEGRVYITGGTNLNSGNIVITGGVNYTSGEAISSDINVYNSSNTFNLTDGYSGQNLNISGTSNTVYNSGSGIINYMSGEMNIYNSLLTGFDHDNSDINIRDGGTAHITVNL